jgi:hypothetical protein
VDEAVDALSAPDPVQPVSGQTRADARVLVVEDDAGVRSLIAEVLTEGGYTVATSATPAEALVRVEDADRGLDLLVTDVIMPGMSGRDLAIRVAASRPGVKVLYVSGYAGEAVIRQGGLSRDDHFLQKPFSEAALLQGVSQALENHSASDPA